MHTPNLVLTDSSVCQDCGSATCHQHFIGRANSGVQGATLIGEEEYGHQVNAVHAEGVPGASQQEEEVQQANPKYAYDIWKKWRE